MTGHYDTSGNPEARFEPGSEDRVLANKLGISDPDRMDDIELDLLGQLYDVAVDSVRDDQQIIVANLREWHRRWLGNVYVWAGEYRTVNMGKADFQFAASGQIARLMDELDAKVLPAHTPCRGMSEDRLVEAIAVVHIELILIHPFREGNGRLSRMLASVMALQAGWPSLDFTPWDREKAGYFSAIHAGLDDYEPMRKKVRQVLRASEQNASD